MPYQWLAGVKGMVPSGNIINSSVHRGSSLCFNFSGERGRKMTPLKVRREDARCSALSKVLTMVFIPGYLPSNGGLPYTQPSKAYGHTSHTSIYNFDAFMNDGWV